MCSHIRSTFAALRSRNWTGNSARPGTTLTAAGSALTYPTLPTWLPCSPRTTSRTASTSFEAAMSASFLRFIGVVPAWLAKPVTTQSQLLIPHNSLHYADWNVGLVEVWALFNVQFEISGQCAGWNACISKLCGIPSGALAAYLELHIEQGPNLHET